MNEYPTAFIQKMNRLLGDEAPSFWEALEDKPTSQGLRINTLKCAVEDFQELTKFNLDPLPWSEIGFQVEGEDLGSHPHHIAGLYYLQEPSAMAVAEVMGPEAGERILDLAAAPGGKSTHLASLMGQEGLLVANDPHGGRVQGLARNLERFGTRKALITQEKPHRLAQRWGALFDRVLIDAPCSGEGMFRVHPGEMKIWSPNFIQRCMDVQNELLWFGAQLVRPGGYLYYATCTFSPEENEGRIKQFLQARSDFSIVTIPRQPGFSPGKPEWVDGPPDLVETVRIWPHSSPGEGHYIACLQKSAHGETPPLKAAGYREPDQDTMSTYQSFVKEYLQEAHLPPEASAKYPYMTESDGTLSALSPLTPPLEGLQIKSKGWQIGKMKGGGFKPAHALAMGITRSGSRDRLEYAHQDPAVFRYIRGLSIPSPGRDGWVLVTVDGFPLGWGKRRENRLHSLSPRWLSQI